MIERLAAVGLVGAGFVAASVLARRRDGPPRALGVAAWFLALPLATSAALLAPGIVVFHAAPLPLVAWPVLHVASGLVIGALPVAATRLPARAALFAPVVVLVVAFVVSLLESLLDDATRAWSPLLPLALAFLAATAPRAASLALQGRTPRLPAAVGALAVLLVVLPTFGSTFLGIVWYQPPRTHLEWVVEVSPTAAGPYELRIPVLVSDDPALARVLERLASEAAVAQGDAALERTADALVVRGAGGPVRVVASTTFLARSFPPDARLVDEDWRYDGDGGARVRWTFGPGCGDQLGGSVAVGDVPPRGPMPEPWSPAPPCVHGD